MVRDVFRLARENAPAIIFIDEIDAIATKRFDAQTGADREVQRILLELLNQMDGFDQGSNVKARYNSSTRLSLSLTPFRLSWPPTEQIPWTPPSCDQVVWTERLNSLSPHGERSA
jgi:SpoVK/Ycf46/Vps4 family AAA+-type ATPase